MVIFTHGDMKPRVGENVFVAEGAMVIGDVQIGGDSSVWFNAVIRGDLGSVRIGQDVNVQDCCVLHVDDHHSLIIGDSVVIGHGAVIHGCVIESNCLIGLKSVIMSGAEIGEWSIIGAGSLITQGTRIPSGSVVVGVPGKVVRKVSEKDRKQIEDNVRSYVKLKDRYLRGKTV